MSTMYDKIKKQKGEVFARVLRQHHNGLLEIENLDVIVQHAGGEAVPLLPYLMSLITPQDDAPTPIEEDPFTLLDRAGYKAFYADTLEKQNSIKKYFAPGELLCTFNDVARHENYHIVHAVKKDADKIKRENFHGKEDREDAYGTSVISIQMLKSGGFISIKNRYNHKVVGCDNTFNSNPNYIIPGLSEALKKYFNVAFTPPSGLPEEFVLFGAQILKYHTEHNNIYYGDQAWAKDGVIYTADRSKGDALFGGFLFKNATKSLEKIDPDLPDSFTEDFNRYYAGRPGLCVAKNGDLLLNGKILIGTKDSRITTLYLPEWKAMSDLCLYYATALTELKAPSLETMGNACLYYAMALMKLKAPSLETMGGDCLRYADALTEFEVPKLTSYSKYLMRFIGQRPRVPPAPSV